MYVSHSSLLNKNQLYVTEMAENTGLSSGSSGNSSNSLTMPQSIREERLMVMQLI